MSPLSPAAPTAPLVSIVVTVYKRTEFLELALSSVQKQTFQSYEVLLKDDSGSEMAKGIAASMEGTLPLRYLPNPTTVGIPLSLRAGLEEARGKYVAILNDDDFWEADFLEKLVAPLEEKTDRALAFCDHWIVDATGTIDQEASDANSRTYGRLDLPEGEINDPPTFVSVGNGIPLAMASIFRRDALDPALLVSKVAGAYDFWISCLLASKGRPFYYVPKRLTFYRVHEAMETARIAPDRNADMVFILEQVLERNLFPDSRSLLIQKLSRAIFRLGRDRLYFNQTAAARSLFQQAFAVSPDWRPLAGGILSLLPLGLRIHFGFSQRNEPQGVKS